MTQISAAPTRSAAQAIRLTRRALAEIRAVLEAAGVEFTDGDPAGVRLKSPAPPGALNRYAGRALTS